MIDLRNVTKRYGQTDAISDLSLKLHENKIYCLLGRNGAGKTTLMNLIAGKIASTTGEVSVNGSIVNTFNMPENVRYIEAAKTQFNMRISELLSLVADVDSNFDIGFAMKMVDKFHLDKRKKYKALSFGMKTMVTTIISLASNAKIILLDEPVLGFDAVMRAQFYSLLSESYAEHPRIIIVSTHLIDEIAEIAEQIIFIDNGRLIFNEDINKVIEKSYKISGLETEVNNAIKGLNVVAKEKIGKFSVAYIYDRRPTKSDNIDISNLSVQELFVKIAGGELQ